MRRTLLAISFVATCACSSQPATAPDPVSGPRPQSTARLSILEPKTGAELRAGNVVVKLALTGGKITKVVSTNLKPDEGHIHVKLDNRTITLLGSLTETVAVTPGGHVIEAEFVAADHGPFDPRVVSTVAFTVK